MNPEIAEQNFKTLSSLKPVEKLRIDPNSLLVVDDRYLQSIRRGFTGDSRENIINLIDETLNVSTTSNLAKVVLIGHLLDVFKQTYPGYTPIRTMLINNLHKYNCESGRKLNSPIEFDCSNLNNVQSQMKEMYHNGRISSPLWILFRKDDNRTKAIVKSITETMHPGLEDCIFDIYLHTNNMAKITLTNIKTGTKTNKIITYVAESYVGIAKV